MNPIAYYFSQLLNPTACDEPKWWTVTASPSGGLRVQVHGGLRVLAQRNKLVRVQKELLIVTAPDFSLFAL